MERKLVGIVGAGISGLLAAKYTLSKGHDPLLFESQSKIGGVWTNTVESTKLQTPKQLYEFSDCPWPSSVTEDFPDAYKVLDYIESYARHYKLMQYISFNSKVVSISYVGSSDEEIQSWTFWNGTGEPFGDRGKWNIVVQDTQTLSTEVYQVDFVVLCLGRFSDVPDIPEFPMNKGPEVFDGEVIHSKDYAAMDNEKAAEFVKGKRVTVVGFQKSALDIAMECSKANGVEKPCTVICRTPHWNLPDYIPWGVPLGFLYLSRFSELLVHKPGQGLLLSLLAVLLSPMRWAISKFVESDIKHRHKLSKFGMVPNHSFLQDINSCQISTVPKGFYDNVEEGSIVIKKSPSFVFCKEGSLLKGEVIPIETDLVILATGFKGDKKLRDIFASRVFQDNIFGASDQALPLYRECIHPRVPQLAVIGFSESVSNLYTSEMRCRWLAELFNGTFKLPSIREMEDDTARWDQFMKQSSGKYYRRSCIGALHIWYNDQLCKDMGWNPKRKKGLLDDLFQPYGPHDYAQN